MGICSLAMGNVIKYLYDSFNKYRLYLQLNSAIKYLEHLGEGSVDLELNKTTGIATILINHPKKKNAISGKYKKLYIICNLFKLHKIKNLSYNTDSINLISNLFKFTSLHHLQFSCLNETATCPDATFS